MLAKSNQTCLGHGQLWPELDQVWATFDQHLSHWVEGGGIGAILERFLSSVVKVESHLPRQHHVDASSGSTYWSSVRPEIVRCSSFAGVRLWSVDRSVRPSVRRRRWESDRCDVHHIVLACSRILHFKDSRNSRSVGICWTRRLWSATASFVSPRHQIGLDVGFIPPGSKSGTWKRRQMTTERRRSPLEGETSDVGATSHVD